MGSGKLHIRDFQENLQLVRFSAVYRIDLFSCGIGEYDTFLTEFAQDYENRMISATHLLVNRSNADIVAYMTLSMASITISEDEKEDADIGDILFNSIPSMKIGKLAVSLDYRKKYSGIGSLMIQIARGIANDAITDGVATRFIVIDADVGNDPELVTFYSKNGFKRNERYSAKKNKRTLSMRLDILLD